MNKISMNKISMNKNYKKGFTLVELLVVIAIIGLLSTIAVVSLGGSKTKANDAKRISDLKVLEKAIHAYGNMDSSYNFPNPLNWMTDSALLALVGGKLPEDVSGSTTRPYIYCSQNATKRDKFVIVMAKSNTLTTNGIEDAANKPTQGFITTSSLAGLYCKGQTGVGYNAAANSPDCSDSKAICLGLFP